MYGHSPARESWSVRTRRASIACVPRVKRPLSLTLGDDAEEQAATLARALGLDEKRGRSAAIRHALAFTLRRLSQAVRLTDRRRAPKPRRDATTPAPERWVDPEES